MDAALVGKAVLEISGCCKHYRATLILRTKWGEIVTLEKVTKTWQQSREDVLILARMMFPGFEQTEVREKNHARK